MLSGYRVLIVEDEAIVAQDLSDAINEAEGEVIGPYSGTREARAILKTDTRITAAGSPSTAHSNPDLYGRTSPGGGSAPAPRPDGSVEACTDCSRDCRAAPTKRKADWVVS